MYLNYMTVNLYLHQHSGLANKCVLFKSCKVSSVRNKGQKLVGRFFENQTFCRLLIAVPLKMYSKFGRPKWILVSQMLKLVGKWPMASCYF